MSDLVRIFLIGMCMILSYILGRKTERMLVSKRAIETLNKASKEFAEGLNKIVQKHQEDAPVPDIANPYQD